MNGNVCLYGTTVWQKYVASFIGSGMNGNGEVSLAEVSPGVASFIGSGMNGNGKACTCPLLAKSVASFIGSGMNGN